MYALQAAVAAMGMFYPCRDVTNEQRPTGIPSSASSPRCRRSRPRSIAFAIGDEPIPPRDDLDHAANFYYMLFEREPSPAVRKVIDACLILHAEHTMNASTFSGRVTGSTLANPYTVISSAIGTLTGPLHGGANEEVLDMLEEVAQASSVKAWVDEAIAKKKKIMGFGHRVYKVKDPRATVLQELAEQVFVETGRPHALRPGRRTGKSPGPDHRPKGNLSERRFLFGHHLRIAGHSARSVHAHLRHRPRGRLAGPLARADSEQSHLSAGADLRRQAQSGIRAAGEEGVGRVRGRRKMNEKGQHGL